jgi:hypothetical protein
VTNAAAGCAVSGNATMSSPPDIVRFDEEENPTVFSYDCIFGLCITPSWYVPVVRQVDVNNSWYDVPGNPADALAGWLYINLDNEFSGPRLPDEMATQAWVIVSMSAEGRFSVDFDAASLGNGCSPRAYYTDEDGGDPAIGPAPNVNPGAIQNP